MTLENGLQQADNDIAYIGEVKLLDWLHVINNRWWLQNQTQRSGRNEF
jgi:hypothetical protein